jgi:hypothetical protein
LGTGAWLGRQPRLALRLDGACGSAPEGDFPDDLIDEIITDRVNEARYDIEGFMNEWGLELNEYIDKDEFIKAVIDEDGYGTTLNGYDGNAEEITIQNELFYVMRID